MKGEGESLALNKETNWNLLVLLFFPLPSPLVVVKNISLCGRFLRGTKVLYSRY